MLALLAGANPAAAEFQVGVYGGISESFDSDVTLVQPNGTNLTLEDVPWDGKSFVSPPYWGVRGIYWLDSRPSWGLLFDCNHAKIYSDLGALVKVKGTRDGVALSGTDRVSNTFDILEFTDGLNEFYLGSMYRWQHERWTPYAGSASACRFLTSRSGGPAAPSRPSNIKSAASRSRVWSVSNIASRRGSRLSAIISSAFPATTPT
jgi:hypothetical protein